MTGIDYYNRDGSRTDLEGSDLYRANFWTKVVAKTYMGFCTVSTVFLLFDHSWGEGEPILFETTVFGGRQDSSYARSRTEEEALATHRLAVSRLSKGEAPFNG